jgi:hypothetical protein
MWKQQTPFIDMSNTIIGLLGSEKFVNSFPTKNYAQPIPTPTQILRKMNGVTQNNDSKII